MECAKCKLVIAINALPLVCCGCMRSYHHACTSLVTKTAAKLITDNVNVLFKCDECLSKPSCGEQEKRGLDVKIIEEEMKKISSLSDSIEDIRNKLTVQIETALNSEMEKLRQNVNGTLKNIENLVNKKMETMTSSCLQFNAGKNKSAAMKNTRGASKSVHLESTSGTRGNKRDEIVDVEDDDVFEDFEEPVSSWVTVVKNKRKSNSKGPKPNKPTVHKARPVIVVKPKESNQCSDATRKFLNDNLDPKKHKISNFRNGKDGSVLVECATGYNVDVVKNGMQSDLGENYTAVVPSAVPRLKVVGMSYQYSSDVFIDYLKSHNEDIAINDVKVIHFYENPRFRYKQYNAVIEVDKDTYGCLLTAKKVNVKFDRCFVVPAINVLRCYQCGEFGHMSTECKNNVTCSKCSGSHKTSDCTSTVLKCVNCLKMNKNRNAKLDVNHPAFSTECEIFRKLYEQKKSSLHFNE